MVHGRIAISRYMLFQSYVKKKELEDYQNSIAEYSKDYATVNILGEVGGYPIQHLVINPKGTRTLCFVAGLHGNEEGGPYGILEFMKQKMRVPEDIRVEIVPIANPTGFIANTRKNYDGIDINRKFFDKEMIDECSLVWKAVGKEGIELLTTLHEDPNLKTFYLYYTHHNSLAKKLRDDVGKKYFKIFGLDERKPLPGELYGDKVHEGLIPLPYTKRGTIEDRVLEENGVPYITTETPGKAMLKTRTICNRDIIKYIIHNF